MNFFVLLEAIPLTILIPLPVLIPLVSGALLLLIGIKKARAFFAVFASLCTLGVSFALLQRALTGNVLVTQMASWPAPWGISLVVDILSAIMLTLSSIVALLSVVFANSSLQHEPRRGQSKLINELRERFGFQALLQFLIMGVNMSFLTGDLFNLFVAFEVMLIASYGLLLIGNDLPQLREGFKYVVINLVVSAVFVMAAGLTYGLVGTLNMADIGLKVSAYIASNGPDARLTLVAMMLALVFATKTAMFPLGFWLPNAYPVPAAAASAFFAAILTKVGAYTLIRTFTLMFPEEPLIKTILFSLAGLTMLAGALGMIAQSRWRHALAFANVASVGYLMMGVFSGGVDALSAALFYLMHSVMVVLSLFFIAALAEKIEGLRFTSEGHLNNYPWLGLAYFIGALAIAGMPPSSGFIGKFSLIASVLQAGGTLHNLVAAAAVIAGFLLLYAAIEIWRGFFWGEDDAVHKVPLPLGMKTVTAIATSLVVALAIFSGPLYKIADQSAAQLLNSSSYIEAVLVSYDTPRIGDVLEDHAEGHDSHSESEGE